MKQSAVNVIRWIRETEGRERRELGCLMADLPPILAKSVVTWANAHIPDEVIYQDEKLRFGREKRPHVTVKFGFTAVHIVPAMRKVARQTRPFLVKLGSLSLFKNEDYDVVKLGVLSQELHVLNAKLCGIPNNDEYPTFKPHCTLAYVIPGSCDNLVGAVILRKELDTFVVGKLRFTGKSEDELKLGEPG